MQYSQEFRNTIGEPIQTFHAKVSLQYQNGDANGVLPQWVCHQAVLW